MFSLFNEILAIQRALKLFYHNLLKYEVVPCKKGLSTSFTQIGPFRVEPAEIFDLIFINVILMMSLHFRQNFIKVMSLLKKIINMGLNTNKINEYCRQALFAWNTLAMGSTRKGPIYMKIRTFWFTRFKYYRNLIKRLIFIAKNNIMKILTKIWSDISAIIRVSNIYLCK